MNNNKKKGFTLVELLVVIAILAILATVSVVGYTAFINNANKTAADQEVRQIEQVLNSALIVNKEVYVVVGSDTQTTVKISKSGTTVTVASVASVPETAGTVNLTADLGDLAAKLTFVAATTGENAQPAKLVYTGNNTTQDIVIK